MAKYLKNSDDINIEESDNNINLKISDNFKNDISSLRNSIGDVSNLLTEKKDNTVGAINELYNSGQVFTYLLPTNGQSYASGAWRDFTQSVTTEKIPKGKYIVIFGSTTGSGGNNGIVTARLIFDDNELDTLGRTSVPTGSGLTSTFNAVWILDLASKSTHTLKVQTYSSVNLTVGSNALVHFVRIGN